MISVASVSVCAFMALGVAGCATGDDGPRQTAQRFADAVDGHDLAAAAGLTDNPTTARTDLDNAWSGLAAQGVSLNPGKVAVTGDTALAFVQQERAGTVAGVGGKDAGHAPA